MKNSELNDIEARAADWVAERDRCDGQLHPLRQAELDAWLAASTAHRVAWLRLDQAWQRAQRLRALQPPAQPVLPPAPAPRRGGQRAGDPREDRSGASGSGPWSGWTAWAGGRARPALVRGAAALGLAALAVLAGLQFSLRQGTLTHSTERGQRELVTLADGSRLTLNTATQLRTAVSDSKREVWLERGEAFFDVAHDAKRPFVIHAGSQTVTVLGTKFSLYRERGEPGGRGGRGDGAQGGAGGEGGAGGSGDKLRVAVLEGRVQVQGAAGRAAILTRDEAALADAGNVLVTRQTPQQLQASLGWLQGKLVFHEVNLAEAARQFNRYGRKQLVIQDEAAARIAIGGVFDASNVEAFARLLHAGFGLEVTVVGEEIRVGSAPVAG